MSMLMMFRMLQILAARVRSLSARSDELKRQFT